MIRVLDLTFQQLKDALAAAGQADYRAAQVADWIYRKGQADPQQMTNLPPQLRSQLLVLDSRVIDSRQGSDGTLKLLLGLHDGLAVETVLIPSGERATACLSTQVGCGMGCLFCASASGDVQRNLTAGEILQQVLHLQQQAQRKVTNVVYMGMGEPLANYDATVASVRALIDPQRFGISARNIVVSTIGLPVQIRKLAGQNMPITLAISLHAPNDALRRQLMPATGRYQLKDVLEAAREFYASRKREVTLEYLLIEGMNDTNVCAQGLARIAHSLRCNVNLIPYNPVAGTPYKPASPQKVQDFAARLSKAGVNVHVRRSRGADLDAACGQLRLRHVEKQQ